MSAFFLHFQTHRSPVQLINKINLHFTFREHNDIDVNAVYHQLVATYTSDSDDHQQPGTSTGSITPAGRRRFVRIINHFNSFSFATILLIIPFSDPEEQ